MHCNTRLLHDVATTLLRRRRVKLEQWWRLRRIKRRRLRLTANRKEALQTSYGAADKGDLDKRTKCWKTASEESSGKFYETPEKLGSKIEFFVKFWVNGYMLNPDRYGQSYT